MATLHLTLKKKWYDMISSGEKLEEYREIKEHWVSILCQLNKPFILPNFAIYYKKISKAFCFCWGYKGGKLNGLEFLLTEWASLKSFDKIKFTNGYSRTAPSMTFECKGIEIGFGKPEWGAPTDQKVFIIKLGKKL